MGTAIMHCVKISVVGDTTAAKTKAKTIRSRRFCRNIAAETIPILARKRSNNGNSKTIPKGNTNATKKDK